MVFDKDMKRYLFFPLARPWAAFEHLWPPCLAGDWTPLSGDFRGNEGCYYFVRSEPQSAGHNPPTVPSMGTDGQQF